MPDLPALFYILTSLFQHSFPVTFSSSRLLALNSLLSQAVWRSLASALSEQPRVSCRMKHFITSFPACPWPSVWLLSPDPSAPLLVYPLPAVLRLRPWAQLAPSTKSAKYLFSYLADSFNKDHYKLLLLACLCCNWVPLAPSVTKNKNYNSVNNIVTAAAHMDPDDDASMWLLNNFIKNSLTNLMCRVKSTMNSSKYCLCIKNLK